MRCVAFALLLCCVSDDEEENREVDASAGRFVRYQFTPAFLKLRTVGATWVPTHSPLPPTDDHGTSSPLFSVFLPTGWNSQLETDPWTIFGWSSGTTSAITCWRASTLTLASVSQTVETPASTFMSSPSCLRAWVSQFNQATLTMKKTGCHPQHLPAVLKFWLVLSKMIPVLHHHDGIMMHWLPLCSRTSDSCSNSSKNVSSIHILEINKNKNPLLCGTILFS